LINDYLFCGLALHEARSTAGFTGAAHVRVRQFKGWYCPGRCADQGLWLKFIRLDVNVYRRRRASRLAVPSHRASGCPPCRAPGQDRMTLPPAKLVSCWHNQQLYMSDNMLPTNHFKRALREGRAQIGIW